ncbi:MAG: DHH family phosphoesterase [Oscillospiraceae bacterium]|jgi:phosphoesterase RecJ-like protein|nr:DHH family phosphoesterase [Oscillospiraceae bacterium]
MTKHLTIKETGLYLLARDNFLILTHRRPDGDTLGSAASLCRALKSVGKTAFLLANPETTPRYAPFTDGLDAPPDFSPACVVSVDTASEDLFPDNAQIYVNAVNLSIDHHPSNTGFADFSLLDAGRAACGELVLDLISEFAEVDTNIATALYVAVSTDTGCFSFDNTTADTFAVASKLASFGAPISELNRTLFRAKSRGRIAVEGLLFTNIEFHFNDHAAIVIISNAMSEQTGADEDDMDNIAALPVSIEGVEVGITIRELKNSPECKVSVRSVEGISANGICAYFGGGGHARAAGFTSSEPADVIKERLLPILAELLS